jgi:sugar lactone lactonase YvrE
MTGEIRTVLPVQALNGERPAWDGAHRRLFWVDVREPALHEFDPARGTDRRWEMPAWIGCYALTETGAIVALRTGLFALDFATGALAFLAAPPFDPRRFIFNEGDCDRQGRFWAGPMYTPLAPGDENASAPKALPFWRFANWGWHAGTGPVHTANSLAWSADGTRMFHSDTERKTIWVAEYDTERGEAVDPRVFITLDLAEGGPDGMALDRDGFLWCALYGAGRLVRLDPDGRIERTIEMPVQYPTMPAFGGDGLRTLFITSASWSLSPEERARRPREGNLLAMEVEVGGYPAMRLRSGAQSDIRSGAGR